MSNRPPSTPKRPPRAYRTEGDSFLEWYPRIGTALTLVLLILLGVVIGAAFGLVVTQVVGWVVAGLDGNL